jgi:hypothetical protein
MMNRQITHIAFLAAIVVVAFGYLAVTVVNLFSEPMVVSASNNAPQYAYERISLGEGDWVWNWDYNSQNEYRSNVDWAMRFIFKGNAEIDYIKDRLDGKHWDPSIHPNLGSMGWSKYSKFYDGGSQTDGEWDSDRGIKDDRNCNWNWGHMRFYASSSEDRNYNQTYGYYVVATNHVDSEYVILCTNYYKSLEEHEDDWIWRIQQNLTASSGSDYNWVVYTDAINWENGVYGTIDIGNGNHTYQSDGLGAKVHIPTD